ncbi:hypothetical protein QJS10_CPA08g00895 [Acorus calamus]|uniref:Uncharacterized protein n=1 Tax=Acorus calamus TaxID=4465 RepID=A0AAV9EBI5_ACOCL|nr:hypothetical protein QJS10_CPA08g00895 [Acorus calamus]
MTDPSTASGSLVRLRSPCRGVLLYKAVELRYRGDYTKDEEVVWWAPSPPMTFHHLLVLLRLSGCVKGLRPALPSSDATYVKGFTSLWLLNLEDNCIHAWDEVMKLSQLRSLEQLHLDKNKLRHIFYAASNPRPASKDDFGTQDQQIKTFEKLHCLLLEVTLPQKTEGSGIGRCRYSTKYNPSTLRPTPILRPECGSCTKKSEEVKETVRPES